MIRALSAMALCLIMLSACTAVEEKVTSPVDYTAETSCRICGMLMDGYEGAKAQVHYANGGIDHICNVQEMLSFYHSPIKDDRMTALYVNDMGKADWNAPKGHWIDASRAVYIYGSNKKGSMGDRFVPFGSMMDAGKFADEHGGTVLGFDEITLDMLKPIRMHKQSHSQNNAEVV